METDIFDRKTYGKKNRDDRLMMHRHCATAAIRGRRGADDTSHNLGLPAGGIRRPQLRRLTHWGRRSCGNPWSLAAMTGLWTAAIVAAGTAVYELDKI